MTIKAILDTDPGVGIPGTDADDPIAILLALADPRIELLGITTIFGNCPPTLGARGAKTVLAAAGRSDIPVHVGMSTRIDGTLHKDLIPEYQGTRGDEGAIALNGLSDHELGLHAIDFIIQSVLANPGEITIIAVGPQSNIAMALLKEPGIASKIKQIVFMGGALGLDPEFGRGNITPVAECNIWYDAQAADLVFRSGIPLTMVSLDTTNPNMGTFLSRDVIERLAPSDGPVQAILSSICKTYLEKPMFEWGDGCVLYDPLAVAVAADPDLGVRVPMHIAIETQGVHTYGQTVPYPGRTPNISVLTNVSNATQTVAEMVQAILSLDSNQKKDTQ